MQIFKEFETVSNHLLIDMKKFKSWVMQYIKIENVKNYPKLTERDLIFLNDKLKNDILKDSGSTSF